MGKKYEYNLLINYIVTHVMILCTVNSRVEAAASTQVRSPVWLIGSGQSQGAAYTRGFLCIIQYLSLTS